jgi:hypothetical protein
VRRVATIESHMTARRGMPSLTLAVTLLAVGCLSDNRSAAPRQPPRLVFTQTTQDCGRVEAGRQVTQAYAFRNTGGLDLSIDNVRAACRCIAAPPPTRIIPPGGEGTIDVTFDSTGEHGPQKRTITVYSNDPVQPVTTLTLTADVAAALAAEPPRLYVGHVRRGAPAPNSVRLVGPEVAAARAVEATGTVLEASLDGAAAQRTPATIRVTVKPHAPLGRFREELLVRTQDTRQPLLAIPVVGIVDPDDPPAATGKP